MDFIKTDFQGICLIKNLAATDKRGSFNKKFQFDEFTAAGIDFTLREQYYSVSRKNVLRGMHFQAPPHEHSKLIYVISGSVLDVALDIRKDSPTYGKCFETILDGQNYTSLFIPSGFAHGFLALEDDTVMLYNVSSVYNKENDLGIKWDTIGYDWKIKEPILTERDKSFPSFDGFKSPF